MGEHSTSEQEQHRVLDWTPRRTTERRSPVAHRKPRKKWAESRLGGIVVLRLEPEQSRMKQHTADEKEKWQSRLETEQAAEKLGNGVTGREQTEERRSPVGIVGSVAERRNTQVKSLTATEQSERQERQSRENTVRTWEHSCRATDT
jgi:hypothetical protein